MRIGSPLALILVAAFFLGWSAESRARLDETADVAAAPLYAQSKKRKKKRITPPAPRPASPSNPVGQAKPRRPSPIAAPSPVQASLNLQRHVLPNGLRLLLQPDPTLPSVAVSIAYRAGSSFETEGEHGFAGAVFQHLEADTATKPGAPHLPAPSSRPQPDLLLFTTLVPPSSAVLALWREAHRIARPIDAAARDRLRANLRALGPPPPAQRIEQLAYQGCEPYEHMAFGWTDDLERADADALEAFRRRLVSPSRAVITLTGRFDAQAMLEETRRLFGPMPPVMAAPAPTISVPDQINQRVDLEKPGQPTAQFFVYGWTVPPAGHPDLPAIRLAVAMLRDRLHAGLPLRSDRLSKLPDEARLHIVLDERVGPSLLTMRVDLPPSLDMRASREIVDDAMWDLATRGPSAGEMQEAWRIAHRDWLTTLAVVDARAAALTRTELLQGDAMKILARSSDLVAANREEVRRAARTYLTPIRRNLVERRATEATRSP